MVSDILNNKNNKVFVVISVFVVILVCLISFLAGSKKDKVETSDDSNTLFDKIKKESEVITDNIKKDFTRISVDDYLNYYHGSEDTLILVGRSGCNYCHVAEPIIQNIMFVYDIDIKYLSTDDFTEETEDKFMSSDSELNSFSTPLLMVVSNDKIKDKKDELTDTNGYLTFLINNGFIEQE